MKNLNIFNFPMYARNKFADNLSRPSQILQKMVNFFVKNRNIEIEYLLSIIRTFDLKYLTTIKSFFKVINNYDQKSHLIGSLPLFH